MTVKEVEYYEECGIGMRWIIWIYESLKMTLQTVIASGSAKILRFTRSEDTLRRGYESCYWRNTSSYPASIEMDTEIC